MTTLYQAATVGDVEVARQLLAAGTPPDTPGGAYEQTPLMEAAANGHTEMVRLLLQAGANPRLQNSLALDFAVRLGQPESVRLLLDAGADPQRSDPEELLAKDDEEDEEEEDDDEEGGEEPAQHDPPLIFDAVYRGNLDIVRMLVDAGARVDGVNQGYGLLAAALNCKNADLFEYLWERKASLEGALQSVAQMGSMEYLERLLEAGADVNADINGTPLALAAGAGHTAIVERLIAAGAELEQKGTFGKTALGEAVSSSRMDCARALLDAGASMNACDDSTLLAEAIWAGRTALLRLLLKRGADPNETRRGRVAPLFHAIEIEKPKMVEALLQHRADPNLRWQAIQNRGHHLKLAQGATPLMLAAHKRQRESVELLLAAGADPSLVDSKGRSAADYAAKIGDRLITLRLTDAGAPLSTGPRVQQNAALLAAVVARDASAALAALDAGASPNAANKYGVTALTEAAKRGMPQLVEKLLAAGADPNCVSKYGESPLRVSTLRSNADVVRALIAGGADVNAKQVAGSIPHDKQNTVYASGESALHDAAVWGTTEILQILLEAGADINFAGDMNRTPLVVAVNCHRMDSAELLLAAGAIVRPEDEVWVAPYRFAQSARSPAYQALVADVSAACGVEGQGVSHLPGVVTFKLTLDERPDPEKSPDPVEAAREWARNFTQDYTALDQKANTLIDQVGERVRQAGYLLVDAGKPIGCGPMVQYVALLPTADKFEAMAAFGVNGNDDELRTADIIRWFRELDAEEPFELRGVKFDTLIIEFHALVKHPADLAARMAAICSDLAAGSDGDRVETIAGWLREQRRIHFWWD
jgi:ankyrin repeat protein